VRPPEGWSTLNVSIVPGGPTLRVRFPHPDGAELVLTHERLRWRRCATCCVEGWNACIDSSPRCWPLLKISRRRSLCISCSPLWLRRRPGGTHFVQQRRLAAILAADVVGYSRLMGLDEAGTLAALKAVRRQLVDPKIAEHQGRIVKVTGDGMLTEFPSVVNAVACAAEVQQAMVGRNENVPLDRRIEFRMGSTSAT
jgi:hypothetical protein